MSRPRSPTSRVTWEENAALHQDDCVRMTPPAGHAERVMKTKRAAPQWSRPWFVNSGRQGPVVSGFVLLVEVNLAQLDLMMMMRVHLDEPHPLGMRDGQLDLVLDRLGVRDVLARLGMYDVLAPPGVHDVLARPGMCLRFDMHVMLLLRDRYGRGCGCRGARYRNNDRR